MWLLFPQRQHLTQYLYLYSTLVLCYCSYTYWPQGGRISSQMCERLTSTFYYPVVDRLMDECLLWKEGVIKKNGFKIIKNKRIEKVKRRMTVCVFFRERFTLYSRLVHGAEKHFGMTIISITGLTTLLTKGFFFTVDFATFPATRHATLRLSRLRSYARNAT